MSVDGAVDATPDVATGGPWPGLTLWATWSATAGPRLLDDFLSVHDAHPRVRLVLLARGADDVDDVGRCAAEVVGERVGRAAASTVPVHVSTGAPTSPDVQTGEHCLLGDRGAVLDPSVLHAPWPGDELALERVILSCDGGRGQRALSAGRIVAVQFMGGLGNQLFQYAVARTLADRTGAALVADRRWFPLQTNNVWELDAYHSRFDAHVLEEADWGRHGVTALQHHPEKDFTFDPTVVDLEPGVLLTGYFQSPKYFRGHERTVRADLTLKQPLSEWAERTARQIRRLQTPVSVHVRRGDYVANAAVQAFHGSCSPGYYARGLELLSRQERELDVVVFSDDPTWAAENVQPRTTRSATTLRPPAGSGAPENLHLLSLVHHSVMANSSFSWWGAWLRRRPGLAIAPRPWFTAPTDTRDLLPKDWITIDGR